jgi:uncharacterized protein
MNSPIAPSAISARAGGARIRVQLLTYFAATFLIAWAAWIPLFKRPSLPSQFAFIGLFAPALAALTTAAVWGGMRGVRDIVRRLTIFKFPLRWALLSALIMPAIYLIAIAAIRVLKLGRTEPLLAGNSPLFVVAGFTWLLLITSGEELGWRGFALPRLLECTDRVIPVSLGLGVIWGLWHLPMYLLPGQSAFPIPLFVIFTSLQSVLYTLVFLKTRGSLLPALMLHAGTDMAPRIFQLARLPVAFWLIVDVTLGLVVTGMVIGMRGELRWAKQWHSEILSAVSE